MPRTGLTVTAMAFSAPRSAWFWCVVWLGIIWGCIWLPNIKHDSHRLCNDENKLFDHASFKKDQPVVIALGNSLLRHGTSASQWLGDDINWLRLTRGGARWHEFAPLLDNFAQEKPQLMILQDSLFLNPAPRTFFNNSLQTVKFIIKHLLRKNCIVFLIINI